MRTASDVAVEPKSAAGDGMSMSSACGMSASAVSATSLTRGGWCCAGVVGVGGVATSGAEAILAAVASADGCAGTGGGGGRVVDTPANDAGSSASSVRQLGASACVTRRLAPALSRAGRRGCGEPALVPSCVRRCGGRRRGGAESLTSGELAVRFAEDLCCIEGCAEDSRCRSRSSRRCRVGETGGRMSVCGLGELSGSLLRSDRAAERGIRGSVGRGEGPRIGPS